MGITITPTITRTITHTILLLPRLAGITVNSVVAALNQMALGMIAVAELKALVLPLTLPLLRLLILKDIMATKKKVFGSANMVQGPVRPPVDNLDAYRISNYQRWWQLYTGIQFPGVPDGRNKRIVANYLAAAANKMAGYVMSPAPTYTIADPGAQQLWDDTVEVNRLASLDYQAALWASVAGDAIYRLGWSVEQQRVTITLADPSQFWARTKADDRRVVEWVAQRYFIQQSYNNEPGNIPDPMPMQIGGAQYNSYGAANVEIVEEWTADTYRLWQAGKLVQDKPNPFGFIPYVIVPNSPRPGQFWGESDFVDLWPLAAEINLSTSVFATVVEYSGAPVVVVDGGSDTKNLRVGPGQLWDLPANSKAYLLEMMRQGGATVYIDYIDKLMAMFRDLSGLPPVVWGDVEQGGAMPRSGAALAIGLNPLLQAIARRRLFWEDGFIQRCRAAWAIAAKMAGGPDYAYTDITLTWADLLTQDTAEMASGAANAALALSPEVG